MRCNDLLSPAIKKDIYKFLWNTTREWQFFTHAGSLGLPEADKSTLTGATIARDCAVDQWNQWMNRQIGSDWFLAYQNHTLEADYQNERKGIFMVAGSNVLVVHRCESIYATVSRNLRAALDPNGSEVLLPDEEEVDLHCILSPPHDDTLKVLPVNQVSNVTLFNQ